MGIKALGYLGVRSDKIEDWGDFAGKLLGMQRIDRGRKALAFRMDDQVQRLIVSDEPGDTLAFMGWEVENRADLQTYGARLELNHVSVRWATKEKSDRRFVEEMICFNDPGGNRVELFYNPMLTTEPFKPGRPISGFATGPFGMGHAVIHVKKIDDMLPFYHNLLDFHISDYGTTPYPLYFFHVNSRHHSFAMVGSGRQGFHHFMVEFKNLDDVGQGFDLAQMQDGRVAYTLGRHTNDYMTSYYANSPSGFFVENGWGGRVIDPQSWEPHETHDGPSFWGHERLYLPEDGGRKRLRDMRLDAASRGVQAPLLVDCPWLYQRVR